MLLPRASRLTPYVLAVAATAGAAALRVVMAPIWDTSFPVVTFTPAILLSAWFGGVWPGLLATLLSAATISHLGMPGPPAPNLGHALGLLVFVATGSLISWLVGAQRRTRRRLSQNVRDLQDLALIRADADEARSRLAAIVQFSDDAIISKNLNGTITSWNAAAEQMFGYTEEEIVGRPITTIIPGDRLSEEAHVISAIRRGEVVDHFETLRLRKDGTQVPVSLTVSPLRDGAGEIVGASKIARDFSAREAADAERAKLLAREHTARMEAELANRRRDEFLAMLGHELRNPLAAISSAAYVLGRAGGPDSRDSARLVIARQTTQLARILDDLLDVARAITGKIRLDPKPVDLHDATQRVVAGLRDTGQADRHRITLEGEPIWIHGDLVRLEQIISNLLTNALKFTAPGGSIRVQVAREEGTAVLRVADSGIGITEDMLPRVFELFAQGPTSLDRTQGGLGIGLTLVKQLTELHGGRVEAQSAGVGLGTTITVRFPAVGALGADAEPPASGGHAKLRILIVEDNDDSREMLRTILELWNHDVREAADGPSAVERANEFGPDVALIDVGLPGLDGYEVCRRLRASPGARTPRLIALTGYGQAQDVERARAAGFDAHLVKPVPPDHLMELLAAHDCRFDMPSQ